MRIRNTMVWLHRWLALGAGVFWGVAALTGGALVYEHELERFFNGGRFEVSGTTLPPGGLDAAIAENFPGETVTSLAWLHADNVVRMTVRGEAGARPEFLDGGTGRVVENMRPRREVVALLRRAHTTLLAGRYGYWLVTAASAAAVLSMLTGLYLWWPGIRTFLTGFAVRFRRGAYILNFDLHQMLGAVTFVLLFIMTGTGVIMGTPGAGPALARVLLPEDPPRAAVAPAAAQAGPAAGVEALVVAAEAAAGGRIGSLSLGDDGSGIAEARVMRGGERGEQVVVRMSRADGRVLEVLDPGTWNRESRMGATISRWHTGGFASPLVRALFAAACGLGVVVFATGLVVWWLKRTRKLESAKRRAVPA